MATPRYTTSRLYNATYNATAKTFTISGQNISGETVTPLSTPSSADLTAGSTFTGAGTGKSDIKATFTYIGAVYTTSGSGARTYDGFLASYVNTKGATVYYFFDETGASVSSGGSHHPTATTFSVDTGVGWDLAGKNGGSVYCFMAGTAVRMPGGDVAVETLKIGDVVTLSDGRTAPVSWLGRQTVSTQFADPLRVLPIRIKADALGESLPARDLLLSPDHALLVDGILAQAGALVNGVSIIRETQVPAVFTYYHVEVADHSLILAENVPAETFVDNVDRMAFDNWDEHQKLYGDAPSIAEMDYPRAKAARQVPPAIRARLLTLGEALYGTQRAAA